MELVQCKSVFVSAPAAEYDARYDDIRSIIMDLCDALADSGGFEFRVAAFGDGCWPVDVRTDLATVLEQLPRCLEACRRGAPFELDFFEQGVERTIEFSPADGRYVAHCRSRTNWTPDPETESIEVGAVRAMLDGLKRTFCEICERVLPETAAHPWFRSYASRASDA
jgi:hypothetical protein